ncbi:hypothetical protein KCU77_g1623, partial [Aureobasidium melanogenum]
MSARLPPFTHIATTTGISTPIDKMNQQWTFERADLAPLPFEEYGLPYDQAHVDDQLPADPITFPQNDPHFYDDLMMNHTSYTAAPYMEMSAALQCLRSENPFLNTAGPEPIHDFQAAFNPLFNVWDSPAADIIRRSNNFSAQQVPVSDTPQGPFPINDGMGTNNNPRGATMLDASNNIEGPLLENDDNTNVSRRRHLTSSTTTVNHQHNNQHAAPAPDGNAPLFFGEHEKEKDMWVNTLRAAGTAPTVLRGGQMSAETAASVEANHILISDPAWVSELLEAPVMDSLPLLSQPVTYLPVHDPQVNDHYPVPVEATQYWDVMPGGAGQSAYGHHPDAGEAGYAYGNSAVTYPTAHIMTNYAFQGAGNNPWDTYPAPAAPMMSYTNPSAAVPVFCRSCSPAKHQTLPYRRRSPPCLNPIAPSFAPGASGHQPSYTGYPIAPDHTGYATVQGYNLAGYGGIPARRGAWKFSGGVDAANPYLTRLQEARVLAGQQGRFEVGSDDVRNHLSSVSSAASNEEDAEDGEHESDEHEGVEEEEDEEEEEDANTTPIPRKRQGKFHAGNTRISCDECGRKHIKCVRPNPNRYCIGCLRAHRGLKVCKITKGSGT